MREWAIVTVALAASSRFAIGLPTMLERPTTTAVRPDKSPVPSVRRIITMAPAGVQGTKAEPSWPVTSLPTLTKEKPSTSLSGGNRLDDLAVVDMVGHAQLDENAVNGVVGVEFADQLQELGFRRFGGQPVGDRLEAAFLGALALGTDVKLACRILADDDDGDARLHAGFAHEFLRRGLDRFQHLRRDHLAVNPLCHALFSRHEISRGHLHGFAAKENLRRALS